MSELLPMNNPREPEILISNHNLFIHRAERAKDWEYKTQLVADARACEERYRLITGKELSTNGNRN